MVQQINPTQIKLDTIYRHYIKHKYSFSLARGESKIHQTYTSYTEFLFLELTLMTQRVFSSIGNMCSDENNRLCEVETVGRIKLQCKFSISFNF